MQVELPNARGQARLKAGARHERTLEAVACTPLFGAVWQGRQAFLPATWLSGLSGVYPAPTPFALAWLTMPRLPRPAGSLG